MKTIGYVALDTETGGLEADKNALLEIAVAPLTSRLELVEGVEPFHATIKPYPGSDLHPRALHVNKHFWAKDPNSPEFQAALTEAVAWERLSQYLAKHFKYEKVTDQNGIVMVGWNVGFDENFLKAWCARVRNEEHPYPFHYHKLDLMGICRYLDVVNGRKRKYYSLEMMADHYFGGAQKFAMHTAIGDVMMAIAVTDMVRQEGPMETTSDSG